jgi:hypothetical protein
MKTKIKPIHLLIFLLLALPVLLGCAITQMAENVTSGVGETGVQMSEGVDPNLYNQVNAQYMKTVGDFSTCYSQISIESARQDSQIEIMNSFMESNVEFANAYREPLAQYSDYREQAEDAISDPEVNGDLQKLLENGATPAQMGLALSLNANVFTEAQMVLPDSQVTQNTQWSVDESFSNMQVILRDCNASVTEYNTLMAPIPAQTMNAIAEQLGKGLPPSLPLLVLSYDSGTQMLDPGLTYPGQKPVQDPFYIPGLND